MKYSEEGQSDFNNLVRYEGISIGSQSTIPIYPDGLGN